MLPFLKKKHQSGGASIEYRSPDKDKPEAEGPEDDSSALDSAASDLLQAIETKDTKAVASALKAAWEICESYETPSEEPSMETE